LTISTQAWDRACALAVEQATTPNDILAQLVVRGLDLVERERSVEQTARSRVGAYRARGPLLDDGGRFPTVEDAEEQALALRRDLAAGA